MPSAIRERAAIALLSVPLALSLVLAIHAYGRVPGLEVFAVALFALGPTLALIGHRRSHLVLIILGVILYGLHIFLWYVSWGGLHLLIGMPTLLLGLVVGRWNGSGKRLHQRGEP